MEDILSYLDQATPSVLDIVLKAAQLNIPERHYTGKVVSEADDPDDCQLILFARNSNGDALPKQALNIEIYIASGQRSLMVEYPERPNYPILWLGQKAVWMDGDTGKTVLSPPMGESLEKMGRIILKKLAEQF